MLLILPTINGYLEEDERVIQANSIIEVGHSADEPKEHTIIVTSAGSHITVTLPYEEVCIRLFGKPEWTAIRDRFASAERAYSFRKN